MHTFTGEIYDYQKRYQMQETVSPHDFKTCSCGTCAVDGGHDYLRRSAPSLDDFIDLSVVELEEPSETLFFS